jgi:hypothetical protein
VGVQHDCSRHTARVRLARRFAIAVAAAGLAAGCGQLHSTAVKSHPAASPAVDSNAGRAHPQAVQPVAGAAPSASVDSPSQVSVGPPSGGPLPQPTSLAQIRSELAASGLSANPYQATLAPNGLAIAPIGAPAAVDAIINAGNQIAHLPYRFGGGHGTYEDTAYDCSGSLSFVLSAAGLLNTTVTSGQLMSWGAAGRGRWVTIFANAGHTFMYVAGLRFDTVALAETGSRWSNRSATEGGGFVARHPLGL